MLALLHQHRKCTNGEDDLREKYQKYVPTLRVFVIGHVKYPLERSFKKNFQRWWLNAPSVGR